MTPASLKWRAVDAVDEFAHKRLGFGMVTGEGKRPAMRWYWRLTPFPWLCNRRELSYGVPKSVLYNTTTTANTIWPYTEWTISQPTHDATPTEERECDYDR